MTHAATQAEVEQALKRAELMIGDPRIDVRWMAERINKLVEALERIAEECYPQNGPILTSPQQWMIAVADNALDDYRDTKDGE